MDGGGVTRATMLSGMALAVLWATGAFSQSLSADYKIIQIFYRNRKFIQFTLISVMFIYMIFVY